MIVFLSYILKKKITLKKIFFFLRNYNNLSFFIILNLNKAINFIIIKNMQLHIFIKEKYIYDVVFFLKNSCFIYCNQLLDMSIIDRIEFIKINKRWEFIYMFLSTCYNIRIFLRGFLKTYNFLESISDLFNSANWLEREIWDLFGIYIKNHLDLRRLLTDYNFIGSPLRKDFPVYGYIEIRYDESLKNVIFEPISLMQEFREMRLENVWKRLDLL